MEESLESETLVPESKVYEYEEDQAGSYSGTQNIDMPMGSSERLERSLIEGTQIF